MAELTPGSSIEDPTQNPQKPLGILCRRIFSIDYPRIILEYFQNTSRIVIIVSLVIIVTIVIVVIAPRVVIVVIIAYPSGR